MRAVIESSSMATRSTPVVNVAGIAPRKWPIPAAGSRIRNFPHDASPRPSIFINGANHIQPSVVRVEGAGAQRGDIFPGE
jgi:hypothetical protein